MHMCSACSGECCVCGCGGGCIAGHGDDYFSPASKEVIIERLRTGKYPGFRQYMIDYLKNTFGYEYQEGLTNDNC
jgi:hypothetical protein